MYFLCVISFGFVSLASGLLTPFILKVATEVTTEEYHITVHMESNVFAPDGFLLNTF